MKRSMETSTTPPTLKSSRVSPSSDPHLLDQIDALTAIITAKLEQDGASEEIMTHFGVLAVALKTCKQLLANRNMSYDNSAEEKERRRSVVMLGLPESVADRPSARVQQDQQKVSGILDELGVEALPTTVYRMGRPDVNRAWPRPVKIVLPASVHQHIALGGWKKNRERIKATPNFGRLLIRPSLSREQLQEEYEQRKAKRMQKMNNGTNFANSAERLQQIGDEMNSNQNI